MNHPPSDGPATSSLESARQPWRLVRLPQQALMAAVRGYRLLLSPWLGSCCRFEPSCSAYALQALERHGAWGGTVCSLARLARCHPWCRGGHDPVPERPFGLFSRLLAPPAPSSSPSSSSTEKTAP